MDPSLPELADLRRQRAVAALVPLFVLSGATSLVYETLWERELHLVVGTSQVAVITVLAAFMAGLAAGGFLSARLADRAANPLLAYAALEGLIGAYALAFDRIVAALTPVYEHLWVALRPSPAIFAATQFVVLGLALLPPTIAMGATLPLLARFAATAADEAGRRVGELYGANTLGAVLGVALAGFVLLPGHGLRHTTWITAAGNAALLIGAGWLGLRAGRIGPARARDEAAEAPPWMAGLALLALLAGFSSLLYEVAWFRLMVLMLGGSAYAFSIMLLAFLAGIGLGGWFGGRRADAAWSRGGPAGTLAKLVRIQLGVALLAWGAMFVYGEIPFVFTKLYDAVERAPEWLWPGKLLIALAIMAPPAALMGATFPFLVRAAARDTRLGGPVGRLYGWNTVGAIAGAALGGLVLLPGITMRGTVLVAISINLLAALLAAGVGRIAGGRRPSPGRAAAATALTVGAIALLHAFKPPWNPLLMTAGMYKYASDLAPEDRTRQGVIDFAVTPYELLYYREGLSSVVTVARARKSGNVWLANNGKVDASTRVDMPTQVLVAHLPFVFAPEARDVLVIGLASGITAGSVALHSAPERIDIVEIEPAIVEASHYFDAWNNRPLEDPRVNLVANDGRNFLVLQPEGSYDLVVSEPSNPWLTGVSNLFTREFFEMGRRRLRPGGVWAQWVQMYGMDTDDLRSLLGTFAAVYPHVRLFSTIEDADLVLVGSDRPLELDAAGVARMMAMDAAVAEDLRLIECGTPEDVIARYQADRERILAFAGDTPLNTDDNMRIEYSAPLHLHEDTADANFVALLKDTGARGHVPFEAVRGEDEFLRLARAYARREDWVRALLVLKETERRWPGLDETARLYAEYQERLRAELDEDDG